MKALRWCFILFQCVWLNAVLPGHTRGVVTLPGSGGDAGDPRASVETHACCAGAAGKTDHKNDSPARKPASGNCAICFFAAHMATPPPALEPPAPLGLCETLPAHAPVTARSFDYPFAYLGRGPPVA